MVLMHLPPALRSLHEAVGIGIWLTTFTFAYLARITSIGTGAESSGARLVRPDEHLGIAAS